MEHIGYILTEASTYILLVWFTVRFVHYRRWRRNQPLVSAADYRLLHSRPRITRGSLEFYVRFFAAVLAVGVTGLLEIVVFGVFGAAIVSGTFLLTSVALVRHILQFEA
jgi:hypothetical protein